MEYKQFMNLVKQRKQTVLIITAVFLIVVSLLTFTRPLRYGATSTLLVMQNYGPNTDAYNVSRSNQFLSNLLAQVVYSDSFYEKVMESGYNIDRNIFSADVNKRKREWQDAVYTRAVADTGMIVLKTYHQDKSTADRLNQAIAYTLMTKNGQYHGLGDSVKVKVIDSSTLSDWPVKPNIILNLLLGLIAGLAASLYFIYLFPDKALGFYRRRQKKSYVDLSAGRYEEEISYKPELAYEPAEVLSAETEVSGDNGLDIEEAGEEDEFESYFKGDINNVMQR